MTQQPGNRGWDSATPPERAAQVLIQSYAELAGEEALFRALLAERDRDRQKARFWIGVYGRLRLDVDG